MNDSIVDLFIKKSEAVENSNAIVSSEQFTELHEPDSFSSIPHMKIDNRVDITKNGINKSYLQADYAIADTGTVVIDSTEEDIRLASSLCEHLVVVVPGSKIVENISKIKSYMKEKNLQKNSYIAFITGASRTADIERVLTIGVHGPVKMSIYIINDL